MNAGRRKNCRCLGGEQEKPSVGDRRSAFGTQTWSRPLTLARYSELQAADNSEEVTAAPAA
jgi:hypothetical protein